MKKVVAWSLTLAIAMILDAPLAILLRSSGVEDFMRSHILLHRIMKAPGEIWFALGMMMLAAMHCSRWRGATFVTMAIVVSAINALIKWIVGRFRPFKEFTHEISQALPFQLHPFVGGWHALLGVKNLSFPSGHATLAFAVAAAMSVLFTNWRWLFYTVACVVGVERVLENAHWLSDVVAAAALGMGSIQAIRHLWWDRPRSGLVALFEPSSPVTSK